MQEKSKFERIFTLSSVITLCVSVGALVVAFMGIIPVNRFFLDMFLILAILAFGCITSLSAIKMVMTNKKDVYGYVLLGMTGLVCLLWVICVFVAHGLIDAVLDSSVSVGHLSNTWNFVKVVIFFSLLQALASLVINNWLKYKKKMFSLQIILYVCSFIVTLWLSIVVLSMVVVEDGIALNAGWLLDSPLFATIFVLALVFSGILKLIIRNISRREEREQMANAIATAKAIEAQKANIKNAEESAKQEKEEPKQEDPWTQE